MVRHVLLSNGVMAALFDKDFNIRSLYYPYLDQQHNHLMNGSSKFGIWKDGEFRWLESLAKNISMDNLSASLVASLGPASIKVEAIASQTKPAIVFKFKIDGEGLFRVLLYNDFRLNNSEAGDTAFYDPVSDAVVHYKGSTWIGVASTHQLYEYTTGRRDQGTVINDVQDGTLGKNPIAQGSVDSAVSVASKDFYLFIAGARSLKELRDTIAYLRERPDEQMERDKRYWELLTSQFFGERLAKQSAAILIGSVGVNGEIPASLDTDILKFNLDTYAYTWPRDGVFVALALDLLGYWSFTRRFYEKLFLDYMTDEGYLFHRYNADGTYGSTWHPWTLNSSVSKNIQEDETALAIYGLWVHFKYSRDYFALRLVYDQLERAADFLASFRSGRLKVPLMSFDLWEERLGVHAFTAASVYAALRAAADLARTLGMWSKEEAWNRAAREVREGVSELLFDKGSGAFARSITISEDKVEGVDGTADASTLWLLLFNVVQPDDPRALATVEYIRSRLWVKTVGGLARYENDYYQRVPGDYSGIPGNPWIITTLWLAQVYLALDRIADADAMVEWVGRASLPTGVLPEQVSPFDMSPLSVAPLAWSHAEYLRTYAMRKNLAPPILTP